ncbi:MAG: hypothetical protein K5673_02820 [Lachnospiraceae bacterium]|nr:hypothetical protein [Lachnospiraceae bacterium]
MLADQFVRYYSPQMTEYCPVVIRSDGNIFDSSLGHLQTLVSLSNDHDILSKIPRDVSPLLYLAYELKCVIVDYENQIYIDELTPEQQDALETLEKAGLIRAHQVRMTHESIRL